MMVAGVGPKYKRSVPFAKAARAVVMQCADGNMKIHGREIMTRMALIVVLSALRASTMPAAAADHELKLIPSNTHTGSFDAKPAG